MKPWLVRIAALVVFAVSFALPAIQLGDSVSPPNRLPGWACALFASIAGPKALVQSLGQGIRSDDVLIVLSGLINYLFLAILVFSFWSRLVRTRLVLGALMAGCFIATWVFFVSSETSPLIGHYLWIAGAILIVVPDILNARRKTQTPAATPADRIEASH